MTLVTIQQIRKWRDTVALGQKLVGVETFLERPKAWYEDPHWFCPNGHVSGNYLRGEAQDLCLECREPVAMGPPIGEGKFAQLIPLIREI